METTAPHLALGIAGETLACRLLEREGYAILATRYRTPLGEIDIIALDGTCLVFIEVKTRRHVRQGTPEEAVTPRKRHKLVAMATQYLARQRSRATACRFDVVSVMLGDAPPVVRLIRNAFDAG